MNERILPAYPLFVKDPNFSLWSGTELLNRSNLQSWWGAEKRVYGFLKTGGKPIAFWAMGRISGTAVSLWRSRRGCR